MRKFIIVCILLLGFALPALAQFTDELLSIDLAPNPSNGNCLSTDGTNNLWSTCATGGGGGGTDTLFNWNSSTNIISTDGSSTTATTSFSTNGLTANNATITNSTSTTGWFSSLLRAASALFTNATTTNLGVTDLRGLTSAGLSFHSNSGVEIANLGAGGGTNATFNGGVNVTGALGVTGNTSLTTFTANAGTTTGTSTNGTLVVGGNGYTLQSAIVQPAAWINASTSGRSGVLFQNYGTGTAPEFRFTIGDPYATTEYLSLGLTNSGATNGGTLSNLQKTDLVYLLSNAGRDMLITATGGSIFLGINTFQTPDFKLDTTNGNIYINPPATSSVPTSPLTVNGNIETAGLSATGTITASGVSISGSSTIGNATSTTFGVTTLTDANCDVKASANGALYCGTDATGGGGSGSIATTSDLTNTYAVYATGANTIADMQGSTDAVRWMTGTGNTLLVGTSSASSAKLEVRNQDGTSTRGLLRLISNSSSGADYEIRMDSPDADIEFCDQATRPAGCFEINSVMANNQLYFTPRAGSDTGFLYPTLTIHRDSATGWGSVGIGTQYDTPGGTLELAGSTTVSNIFAITDVRGGIDGNVVMVKQATGFIGLGSTTPSRRLTVAGDALFANTYATGTASSTNASTTALSLFGRLFDRTQSAGTNGMVLQTTGSDVQWVATSSLGLGGAGGGTVTSVDMTVPTGFTISGNPVTTSGTLGLAFDTGYFLPTTTRAANWDTSFSWGNHATQGYITDGNTNWDNSYGFVTQGQTVGTSTAGVAGEIPVWTGIRTLGSVATGTLTENVTGLNLSATRALVGGAAILQVDAGYSLASTSDFQRINQAVASTTALNATSPITYTGTTGNISIQVANGSQNGYLSSSDWALFNQKVSSTSIDTLGELETLQGSINIIQNTEIDTSSELAALLTDETGSDKAVFSASPTLTGLLTVPSINVTASSTLGNATSTTLGVTALAVASCDVKASANGALYCGTDATGGGGGGSISTSTVLADTYVTYATGVNTIGTMFNTPHDAFRWISDGTYRTALAGTSSASNAKFEINNQDYTSTRGMLRSISKSSSGSDYDYRIDSPDADIEFCDAATAPNGCFEFNSVMANNQMYLTPRNGSNTSFADPLQTWHRDSTTGAGSIGIGTRFDTPDAKLEIAASSTDTNILALTSLQGATGGDRMIVKRNGFVGIGQGTPNVMLHVATTSGSATHNHITLENTGSFAEGGAGMLFRNSAGSIDMARFYARPGSSFTDPSFRIQVADSSKTLRDRFVIDANGMASTTALRTASSTIDNATTTTLFGTLGRFTDTFVTGLATFLNATFTGLVDIGGGSLEIPNGAAPTVDAVGELAYDTTDDQLLVADTGGTARVIATDEFRVISITMASSSPRFDSGKSLAVLGHKDGLEITQYRCYVVGGTSKVVNLTDGTNDTETITCGTTMTSDTDVATNDTFTADELGYIEMGATTGTVDYLHFEAYARITRE